jgi:DNA repair exonuclease SbcCD ATPase subunit
MADELDVMRAKLANMSKLEVQISKYKKRVEGMNEIQEQMEELEAQNQEYLEKMLNMEAEVETIPILKRQIEEKQSQLVKQSSNVTKFEMELMSKDEELKDFRRKYESSEAKLKDVLKRANLAESRISELDLAGADSDDGVGIVIENQIKKGVSPKTREMIARLERKNKSLETELEKFRSGGNGGVMTTTSTNSESKSQIELLRRENKTLKSEMSARLREKLELQNELDGVKLKLKDSLNGKRGPEEGDDVTKLETLRNQTIALKERLKEKQRSLEKKSVEQAKLENYVKQALAHANRTVKQSQMKYKNSLRMLKSQIEAKQKEITYFAGMLEKSKAAHKREKEMLMSSIYKIGLDLNSRLLRNEAMGVKSDPLNPKSWLGRRRAERRR